MRLMALLVFAFLSLTVTAGDEPPLTEARVKTLLQELNDDDFKVRQTAENTLATGGATIVPSVQAALKLANAEAALRLNRILEKLIPVLSLRLVAPADAKVGEPVKFKVFIKNVSQRAQPVVRCLDGSTTGRRFPRYTRDIVVPKPEAAETRALCGNCNGLAEKDVISLAPGAEFEPFLENGEPSFGNHLLEWTPTAAGKASIKFKVDFKAPTLGEWNGPLERAHYGDTVEQLVSGVPRVTLEANVEIDVKP